MVSAQHMAEQKNAVPIPEPSSNWVKIWVAASAREAVPSDQEEGWISYWSRCWACCSGEAEEDVKRDIENTKTYIDWYRSTKNPLSSSSNEPSYGTITEPSDLTRDSTDGNNSKLRYCYENEVAFKPLHLNKKINFEEVSKVVLNCSISQFEDLFLVDHCPHFRAFIQSNVLSVDHVSAWTKTRNAFDRRVIESTVPIFDNQKWLNYLPGYKNFSRAVQSWWIHKRTDDFLHFSTEGEALDAPFGNSLLSVNNYEVKKLDESSCELKIDFGIFWRSSRPMFWRVIKGCVTDLCTRHIMNFTNYATALVNDNQACGAEYLGAMLKSFEFNQLVEIIGLQSDKKLNGAFGRIKAWYPKQEEVRIGLRLMDGKFWLLPPANIRPILLDQKEFKKGDRVMAFCLEKEENRHLNLTFGNVTGAYENWFGVRFDCGTHVRLTDDNLCHSTCQLSARSDNSCGFPEVPRSEPSSELYNDPQSETSELSENAQAQIRKALDEFEAMECDDHVYDVDRFYSMSVDDQSDQKLSEEFTKYLKWLPTCQDKVTLEKNNALMLYRYYKQATSGDAPENSEEYEKLTVQKQEMFDSWKSVRGTSSQSAMRMYVSIAKDVLPPLDESSLGDDGDEVKRANKSWNTGRLFGKRPW